MPALEDAPVLRPATNGTVNGDSNGVNGHDAPRPETPTGSMALTEYTMNISTPSAQKRANIRKIVPEEYLLPNGYPDVSHYASVQNLAPGPNPYQLVPPHDRQRNLPRLRSLRRHPPHPRRKPLEPPRMQCPTQARGRTARLQLQAARRLQQDGSPRPGRELERCRLLLCWKPRTGCCVLSEETQDPCDHRDAGGNAEYQAHECREIGRACCASW